MSKLNDLYILNGRHSLYICYTSIKLIYKETGRLLWVLWTGRGTYLSWRRREKGQGRESLRSIHRWRDKRVVSHHSYVSNQSILKEINPEYSLEGPMLMQKLQYFGHLMWRANSMEKALMLGKTEGRRRRGQQGEMVGWHHQLDGHEFEQAPGAGDVQGSLACCSPWGCKESDMIEQLSWLTHSKNVNSFIIDYWVCLLGFSKGLIP